MNTHLIRLAFNQRVSGYEDKVAFIAQKIKDRFGEKVDAELPLSRSANRAKLVYLQTGSFDEAVKLAGQISDFILEPATRSALSNQGITYQGRGIDNQHARGWHGIFAQKFDFQ